MVDTIKIAVEHNKLILVKSSNANTQNINGIQVELDCRTTDWADLTKTVAFFRGDTSYGVTLDVGETVCLVPWELFNGTQKCDYEIGVFGVGNNVRLSTNRLELHMDVGSYAETSVSQDPTPTLEVAVATALARLESLTQEEIDDEMLSLLDKVATIKLAATHGQLILVRNCDTAAKTVNGVRVSIEFRSDEWNALTKTITFFRGQQSYGVILPIGATSCWIPWEILNAETSCDYRIGVFGISDDMRLTTNKLKLTMVEGSYGPTTNSLPPTPSAYDQLLAAVNTMNYANVSDVTDCLAEAKAYTDAKFDTLSDAIRAAGQDKNYVYNQNSASSAWEITHNLNKYPSVTVVDSGSNVVVGEMSYISPNELIISFSAPFSGKAYLN